MTPTEPSSGKAANVLSHYETLRRLLQFAEEAALNSEEIEALTALLADYEAVTAENRRLSALNERMREWIDDEAQHGKGCSGEFRPDLCKCGLDALRATLKGEKHE